MYSLTRRIAAATVLWLGAASGALAYTCQGENILENRSQAYLAELDARTASVPYPEGRFYEVGKDGATSVLFGTLHLPDETVAQVPEALRSRIETARLLFVEVTSAEETRMQAEIMRSNFLVDPEGRLISDFASAEDMDLLDEVMGMRGMTRPVFDRLQPWFLNLMAALPQCITIAQMQGQPVLDRVIEEMALDYDVPVEGLETYDQAFAALASGTYEEQVDMLMMGLPMASQSEDSLTVTRDLYLKGEIFKVWFFGEMEAERVFGTETSGPIMDQFYDQLATTRNNAWMEKLVPALTEGDVVVAVGGLHLGGPSGLLPMLEEEGFEVRRLSE